MKKKNLKPFYIIVHNDYDGGASAICIINYLKQLYGKNVLYYLKFCTYKNVDQYVERLLDYPDKYQHIFIADIHVHPELAKEFTDNISLYDHHASASNLIGIKGCTIDINPNTCGAAMVYKYLLVKNNLEYKHLTKLVAIANDYDNYHLKLPNNIAKNMNFIYYYYWGEKFVERFMNGFDKFSKEESEFLKNKWIDIENQLKTTNYIDLLKTNKKYKNKICLITIEPNQQAETNELCEYALKTLKYDIVMCIIQNKNKISTRISENAAKKGFHIGNFHLKLNIGGGHEKAGGATYQDVDHLSYICEQLTKTIIKLKI